MITAVKQHLEADVTLSALLTGGVYEHETVLQLSRKNNAVSSAFDSHGELKPNAIILLSSDTPVPDEPKERELTFEVLFSAESSYTTVEQARKRAIKLLDETYLEPVDDGSDVNVYPIRYLGSTVNQQHPILRVPLTVARFRINFSDVTT